MACGGGALAADERAPGAVVVWWPDGDSQVLGDYGGHIHPTQQDQRALHIPVFGAHRWAWRRGPKSAGKAHWQGKRWVRRGYARGQLSGSMGRLPRRDCGPQNQGTKLETLVYSTGPCWAALGVALAAVKPSHTICCRIDRLSVLGGHAWH